MEELIREMEECIATMERIHGLVSSEKRGYKDEEKTEYERCKKRHGEIQEILKERKYLDEQKNLRDALGGQDPEGSQGGEGEERSFESLGDFASAAYSMVSQRGFAHPRRDLLTSSDAAGGYLVPDKQLETILNVKADKSIVRPLALAIPGDPSSPDQEIKMPALKTGALGEFGGWAFEGLADGVAPTQDNDLSFDQITLNPKEQVGTIKVSERLMRNARGLDAFLRKTIMEAKGAIEDYQFFNGDGATGPTGILNSSALLSLARATTGVVGFADVKGIIARQLDLNGAVWTVTRSAMPQIMSLADDNGNSIFIAGDATKGIADRLMGFPIKWNTHTPAVGAPGDILLNNMGYYLIGDGTSFRIDVGYSGDDFKKRLVTLRALWDVDGSSWVLAPVKRMDNITYSPFVGLAA
ncbi:MAG: phage major capsid protein [Spirochaetales bacterium]|nr:phage major capsid protein [Spirochaetales bacterium]